MNHARSLFAALAFSFLTVFSAVPLHAFSHKKTSKVAIGAAAAYGAYKAYKHRHTIVKYGKGAASYLSDKAHKTYSFFTHRELSPTLSLSAAHQDQALATFFLDSSSYPRNWAFYPPDSREVVVNAFVEALLDKQPHIFVSYELYNRFLNVQTEVKEKFARYGISDPKNQLYVLNKPNRNLPWDVQGKLRSNPIQPLANFNVSSAQEVFRLFGITTFYGPTKEELKQKHIALTRDNFVKNIKGVIEPETYELLAYLVALDPAEWDVYDTKLGLYYLTPKNNPQHHLVLTNNFGRISPDKRPSETNHAWTTSMNRIFASTSVTWSFAFEGHGDRMNEKLEERHDQGWISGIPNVNFASVLHYLNNNMRTRYVGILSCFTTADRILNLARKKHNLQILKYHVIAPVSTNDYAYGYDPSIDIEDDEQLQKKASRNKKGQMFDLVGKAMAIPLCTSISHLESRLNELLPIISEYAHANKPSILLAGETHMKSYRRI